MTTRPDWTDEARTISWHDQGTEGQRESIPLLTHPVVEYAASRRS